MQTADRVMLHQSAMRKIVLSQQPFSLYADFSPQASVYQKKQKYTFSKEIQLQLVFTWSPSIPHASDSAPAKKMKQHPVPSVTPELPQPQEPQSEATKQGQPGYSAQRTYSAPIDHDDEYRSTNGLLDA